MQMESTGWPGSIGRLQRGVITVALALTMALVPLMPIAHAEPPDDSGVIMRGDGVLGFLYVGDGHLAMTYDIEFFCNNPGPPPTGPGGMTVMPPSGVAIEFSRANVPVAVYEYAGPADRVSVFGFLFQNCGLIFDGDPSTMAAEPVAAGSARLRAKFRSHPNSDALVLQSSLVGKVVTPAGERVSLATNGRVEIDPGTGQEHVARMVVRFG